MLVGYNGTKGLTSQHTTVCSALSSSEPTTALPRFRGRRGVVLSAWGLAALALLCVFPLLAAPVQAQQATNHLLPVPQDVRAVPVLPGQIRLGWWRNPNAESYELVARHHYRYRVRHTSAWIADWTTVNHTMFDMPGEPNQVRNYNKVLLNDLTPRTTYEFQVRSVDEDGGTSAAVTASGTAVGPRTVGIVGPIRSVQEGQPLRFTLVREQPHNSLMVILRIRETGDMLPPEGRASDEAWYEQVYFRDGDITVPVVLETVDDGGGDERDSEVTVEVMPYPVGQDNVPLYEVHETLGAATATVTAAGRSSPGRVADRLTAAFEGLPEAHDGETAFTFRIMFSEAVVVTPEAMRTRVLTVAGAAVTGAARVYAETGVWVITVTPDSREDLSITLARTEDCEAEGAVCTSDGRTLSAAPAHIVLGPGPET